MVGVRGFRVGGGRPSPSWGGRVGGELVVCPSLWVWKDGRDGRGSNRSCCVLPLCVTVDVVSCPVVWLVACPALLGVVTLRLAVDGVLYFPPRRRWQDREVTGDGFTWLRGYGVTSYSPLDLCCFTSGCVAGWTERVGRGRDWAGTGM